MLKQLIAVSALLLFSDTYNASAQDLKENEAEILWDVWGVPHIFADNLPAAVYANGYSQAKLHGNALLPLYVASMGRLSEFVGAANGAQSDLQVWGLELHVIYQSNFEKLTEQEVSLSEAFAAGFSDYIEQNKEEFPVLAVFGAVLPLTAFDVAAFQYFVYVQFAFRNSVAFQLPRDDAATLLSEDRTKRLLTSSSIFAHEIDFSKSFLGINREDFEEPGSNAWAINGEKSDGNGAKLIQNPHLAYNSIFRWMELQMTIPGSDFNVYGAALVGNVVPAIAFNDYLGWTHTVNRVQNWVTYEVPRVNATHYQYDGMELPFEMRTSYVSTAELVEVDITTLRTVHGIVFDATAGSVLAARWGGIGRARAVDQRLRMLEAKNLEEFEDALRTHQYGFFHTCGATKDGDIFNYFAGHVPQRDESLGDFFFWEKPVDGSTSATFFDDIHPFEDLPSVVNPGSNYVQQANEPPWTMTLPLVDELDPDKFPSYMSLPPYMTSRAQTSTRLMMDIKNITFEQLVELKHSTRHELAHGLIDEFIVAVFDLDPSEIDDVTMEAIEVLGNWDRNFDADSVGAILFQAWRAFDAPDERDTKLELVDAANGADVSDLLFGTRWSFSEPLTTPKGINNVSRSIAALEAAIESITNDGWMGVSNVNIETKYGDVFRLVDPASETGTLPGHGSNETFRNTQWENGATDTSTYGDSWVAVVEFTESGPRAKVLLSYGNAQQGPHVNDQFGLYANKTLRDVWRDYSVIEANLESRETLVYTAAVTPPDSTNSTEDPDIDPPVPAPGSDGVSSAPSLIVEAALVVAMMSSVVVLLNL